MKLKKLLKDIPIKAIKGAKEIEITGICANSKMAAPGNLFIAKKGFLDDGNRYIPEALAAGAVAVMTDMYDPSLKNITQIIVSNVNEVEGLIAAHYYQFPSDELLMVGITGTNGKTTTSFLVKYLLDKFQGPCGLIGTIEYIIGENRYQATRTTPDVITNQKMLREMVMQGCRSAVMEVTSHALDQRRVDYIDYDVAIFTNLTLDHLDYHQNMDNYCLAKKKLFQSFGKTPRKKSASFPKAAISNADSPWHQRMMEDCPVKPFTYAVDSPADLRATNIMLEPGGTSFHVTYNGKTHACKTPLVGRFNVYNCLSAMSVALVQGYDIDAIIDLMAVFQPVAGRLEAVPNKLGLKIYVDFAHSDDALINVLECLRELRKGRIITVFGCGGDRDQTKRPKMAQAVEEYSDLGVVTSDNPRTEDPAAICRDIVSGFKSKDKYIVEVDRREAIKKAIDLAQIDDILLIAGKGHETYQIFSHKIIEFDDRKVAAQLCETKAAQSIRK